MRIVAAIVDRAQVRRYLAHAGLSPDPPVVAPARGPPEQMDLDLDSDFSKKAS